MKTKIKQTLRPKSQYWTIEYWDQDSDVFRLINSETGARAIKSPPGPESRVFGVSLKDGKICYADDPVWLKPLNDTEIEFEVI